MDYGLQNLVHSQEIYFSYCALLVIAVAFLIRAWELTLVLTFIPTLNQTDSVCVVEKV